MDNILSLNYSGIYFSNHDFVEIGKRVDLNIALKSKEITLKNLIDSAKKADKYEDMKREIVKLADLRADKYRELLELYPSVLPIKALISKVDRLKEELGAC